MNTHRGIPMSNREAAEIAARMLDAALHLADAPHASHSNIERLIVVAEGLLGHAGEWMPREQAIGVWASLLDDASIPLESTQYLGLAESLLGDYDRISQLLMDYND